MARTEEQLQQQLPAAKRPKTVPSGSTGPPACSAPDVIKFHLCEAKEAGKLQEEIARGGLEFDGEFFHQHFGEEELIQGFTGLHIDIWLSAQSCHTWIDVQCSSKKPGADRKLQKILADSFPLGYAKSKEAFVEAVSQAVLPDFKQLGEPMATLQNGQTSIYRLMINTAPKDIKVQAPSGKTPHPSP